MIRFKLFCLVCLLVIQPGFSDHGTVLEILSHITDTDSDIGTNVLNSMSQRISGSDNKNSMQNVLQMLNVGTENLSDNLEGLLNDEVNIFSDTLIGSLGDVVGDKLNGVVDNFGDTLTDALENAVDSNLNDVLDNFGDTLTGALENVVDNSLTSLLDSFTASVNGNLNNAVDNNLLPLVNNFSDTLTNSLNNAVNENLNPDINGFADVVNVRLEYGTQQLDENLTNGLEQGVDNLLGGQYYTDSETFVEPAGLVIQNGISELQNTFLDTVSKHTGVAESPPKNHQSYPFEQEHGFNYAISQASERIEDKTSEAFVKNIFGQKSMILYNIVSDLVVNTN